MEISVDPDHLASQKPDDPDLHYFQNMLRVYHDGNCLSNKTVLAVSDQLILSSIFESSIQLRNLILHVLLFFAFATYVTGL